LQVRQVVRCGGSSKEALRTFGAVSPKSVNEPPVFVGRPWSVLPITSLHGLSRLRLLRLLHGGLRAILLRLLL
jgi:hypothetical protein